MARDRVVRAAVAGVPLQALAGSAATPGFARAAGELFAELQRSLVTPARFTSALRAWGGGRGRYAGELAALYSAYRRRLEQLGRPDREGHAWAALDALRADPAAWGGRPVFFYGFDDLTPTQRDAVETLVRHAGRRRRRRAALRARPRRLRRPRGDGRGAAPARDEWCTCRRSEHYAPPARPTLHHLERALFEPGAVRRPPNGAVRLLEAGGERAEAELVGAEVLELLRHGIEARDIAVLLRGDAGTTALVRAGARRLRHPRVARPPGAAGQDALGAGVLALARGGAARGHAGRPAHLAAHAGPARRPRARRRARGARAPRRGAQRRRGAAGLGAASPAVAAARARPPRGGVAEGPEALLAALEAEARAIWTAPHRRRADVLGAEDVADARVAAALRGAASELRGLAREDPSCWARRTTLLEALAAVEVREPSAIAGAAPPGAPAPAGVLLADPLEIRARRFDTVFVCGLQDGEFPGRPQPEPFLSDDERRGLMAAAGLRLPLHEDVLAGSARCSTRPCRGRRTCCSCPAGRRTRRATRSAPSFFVDDVRALLTELPELHAPLSDVTWPPSDAPDGARAAPRLRAARSGPSRRRSARPRPRRAAACWPAARRGPRAGWRRTRLRHRAG